ncbi:hypothetical protein LTR66_012697, partial [Elasticomyces elasticus]
VVDTWAFVLPEAPQKSSTEEEAEAEAEEEEKKKKTKKKAEKETEKDSKAKEDTKTQSTEKKEPEKEKEGEKKEGAEKGKQAVEGSGDEGAKKGWTAYLPSIRGGKGGGSEEKAAPEAEKKEKAAPEAEKEKKTWSSYFPSGIGFSSYLPAKSTLSGFAASHYRDPSKSYAEQLADFSKTPVGAAGLSVLTGSGYSSAAYAGYSAYTQANSKRPAMEYLSMPHTRAHIQRLRPKPSDTLVSNLREPMLTLTADTSSGVHDTLIAACDPQRYKGLGVDKWEEHGSCAENLVLALKELNDKAGLKGPKSVGPDVTINSVPAPLNLFMNIPWEADGSLAFEAPVGKKGDYVRLTAERDIVVVMSACPQDVLKINAQKPTDAHFVVEAPKEEVKEKKKPKKLGKDEKEGKKEDVKKDGEKKEATEKDVEKTEDVKKDVGEVNNVKKDEQKKDEQKTEDVKKDLGKKEDAKKDVGKKEEETKAGAEKDGDKTPDSSKANSEKAKSETGDTKAASKTEEPKPEDAKPKPKTDEGKSERSPSTTGSSSAPAPERKKPKKLEKRVAPAPKKAG